MTFGFVFSFPAVVDSVVLALDSVVLEEPPLPPQPEEASRAHSARVKVRAFAAADATTGRARLRTAI